MGDRGVHGSQIFCFLQQLQRKNMASEMSHDLRLPSCCSLAHAFVLPTTLMSSLRERFHFTPLAVQRM